LCRLDTATLGTPDTAVTALIEDGAVTGQLADCALEQIVGVWHRRPSDFTTSNTEDRAELRAGIGGVLATLPYLNHPAAMASAALKPYQLAVAGHCGLHVPPSLVSTNWITAQAWANGLSGGAVVKPMSREVAGLVDAEDRAGWTRAVHLTQARIEATHHIRLTVVDGRMFAARIDSPYLDWRQDLGFCTYTATTTPDAVQAAVIALMSKLRLRFAALDFAVDSEGRWWFLEVNPNGQWLWIATATGLPIAQAIAHALQHPDPTPGTESQGTSTEVAGKTGEDR
jgi:hypothetical protein